MSEQFSNTRDEERKEIGRGQDNKITGVEEVKKNGDYLKYE